MPGIDSVRAFCICLKVNRSHGIVYICRCKHVQVMAVYSNEGNNALIGGHW